MPTTIRATAEKDPSYPELPIEIVRVIPETINIAQVVKPDQMLDSPAIFYSTHIFLSLIFSHPPIR